MSMRLALVLFLTLILIFANLWIRSNTINIEYKLSSLEKQRKTLTKEREFLIAEKARLTSFTQLRNSQFILPDRNKVIYITSSELSMAKVSFTEKN
ncbi:MAG: hypothetical protein ABDH16_07070 [Thermodesulfovibrionaceae bacterium]